MATARRKPEKTPGASLSPVETVAQALEGYAKRGIFRGYSRGPAAGGKATFRVVWHYNRPFDLELDVRKKTLRFAGVLANVSADSTMYAELKSFINAQQSDDLPAHRRIDRHKSQVNTYNRGGTVSLALQVKDGDFEYGVRRLIHLVHEIFMTFLIDGNYFEYRVEAFDLDPDSM